MVGEFLVMLAIIAIVVILFKIFKASVKLIVSILVNLVVGGLLLLILNLLPGVNMEVNFLTAILTGIFGVPVVIILLIIQLLGK